MNGCTKFNGNASNSSLRPQISNLWWHQKKSLRITKVRCSCSPEDDSFCLAIHLTEILMIKFWTERATPPSKKLLFRPYDKKVNSGKVLLLYNSSKTTSVNPPPFIASLPPKCLFFLNISSRVLITAVEIYMLGRRVGMVPHSGGCYFSLGLLSAHFLYLQTESSRAVATARH